MGPGIHAGQEVTGKGAKISESVDVSLGLREALWAFDESPDCLFWKSYV